MIAPWMPPQAPAYTTNGVLINFKLMRGEAEVITATEVWAEIGKMFVQRACGLRPTCPARSGKPQFNVRELITTLSD